MKLHVLSDLHLELFGFEPDAAAAEQADVIILAGDIHKGVKGIAWARSAFPDKPVIYVAGNHEYYDNFWPLLNDQLRKEAERHDVLFLENDAVEVGGVRFLGCTLWTDFELNGFYRKSQCMRLAQEEMLDYKRIDPRASTAEKYVRLTAQQTLDRHEASVAWLKSELPEGQPEKTVVVTHHYPHEGSCAPKWKKDPISPAFGSNLDLDILLGAKVWIHGHTHDSVDYTIQKETGGSMRTCRVVCNPRGYPPSMDRNTWENRFFDPAMLVDFPGEK